MKSRYRTNWLRILVALFLAPVLFVAAIMIFEPHARGDTFGLDSETFAWLVIWTLQFTFATWFVTLFWIPFHLLGRRHWSFALLLGVAPNLLAFIVYAAAHPEADWLKFGQVAFLRSAASTLVAGLMWAVAYWNPLVKTQAVAP